MNSSHGNNSGGKYSLKKECGSTAVSVRDQYTSGVEEGNISKTNSEDLVLIHIPDNK